MTKATRPNGSHLHLVESQRSERYKALDLLQELDRQEREMESRWSREDLDLIVGAFAIVFAAAMIILIKML